MSKEELIKRQEESRKIIDSVCKKMKRKTYTIQVGNIQSPRKTLTEILNNYIVE